MNTDSNTGKRKKSKDFQPKVHPGNFLDSLTPEKIRNDKLPLKSLLTISLYYPSCGFDGDVIKDCNTKSREHNIVSFIYCDYGIGKIKFLENQNTFLGYHVLGSRNVNPSELIPNGWTQQLPPNFNLEDYYKYKSFWQPFIHWTVYERCENRDDSHGPKRFSVLYIGGEGVASYQALYWSNNSCPKAAAIIQPGTGFGLNWTDFTNESGPLAWVINNNPAGKPELIYFGGGGRDYNLDWNNYEEIRVINAYYQNCGGEVKIYRKK